MGGVDGSRSNAAGFPHGILRLRYTTLRMTDRLWVLAHAAADADVMMFGADFGARRAAGGEHQCAGSQQNEQQVFHKHLLSVSHEEGMLRGSSPPCFFIA